MSENEVVLYEGKQALAEQKRGNYIITSPLTQVSCELKRDVDFGVIPRTKSPSLFKSGAEKVVLAYGLLQHYTIETKIENFGDNPFFMYVVRCDLVKISADGREYVFSSGIGSANTGEKRNGFSTPYDSANSSLKMAQKRALVASAINIGGLSSLFSQDMEDEKFVNDGYSEIQKTQDPKAPITSAQVKRLFAIANEYGFNANEAKTKLASMGFTKASDVTQEKYEEVCKSFENNI